MKNLLEVVRADLATGPRIDKSEHASRMRRFRAAMPANSVAIFVSLPEVRRSNDTHFPYRQNSDIVYLNGFHEPESVLIVTNLPGQANPLMLVLPKDQQREVWDGIREGVDGARANFQARQAYTIDQFEKVVDKLVKRADHVFYRFGVNEDFDARFRKLWEPRQKTLMNPDAILHEMRLKKSPTEAALMRHAGSISAYAHTQAMLNCRPGVTEGQLQGVLEFVFKAHGCSAPAYGSIVATGNNGNVLHYVKNDTVIRDGDLILIDAAGEYGTNVGGYAADITRTFPASGKFSEAQREIYELVLEAQMAAIAAARAGVRMINVHQTASRVLRRGLVRLGILPATSTAHASRKKPGKDQPKALDLKDFYMHGTGHWLGLDVHDVGSYDQKDPGNRRGLRRRVLEPGMVITVEPGLYFNANDTRVPEKYRGIGVRIEDDILITETGNENLTPDVPKTVSAIEALMAKR